MMKIHKPDGFIEFDIGSKKHPPELFPKGGMTTGEMVWWFRIVQNTHSNIIPCWSSLLDPGLPNILKFKTLAFNAETCQELSDKLEKHYNETKND